MRVFVTGASGHIGSAVVPELLSAGHSVIALARSDASATALAAQGALIRRGDLDDLDALHEAARDADGVIHLAFKHELALNGDFASATAAEARALDAMGSALAGTRKPFVGTSGTLTLAFTVRGRAGLETDAGGGPRVPSENATLALAERGVRASVVRLAPTVHSELDTHGFIPSLVKFARKNGFAAYIGDGNNRWPTLHTRDAARLYRLALEAAPAGSRLHGAGESGVPFRTIAEGIGAGLGLPTRRITAAEAPDVIGFLAHFAGLDNPTDTTRTRELLGWEPTHPTLLEDFAARVYFD